MKAAVPLVPGVAVRFAEGWTPLAVALLAVGAPFALFWFGFVVRHLAAVAFRLQDKRYMHVTRKLLSKEYRQ